jgi:hypothetical protein
MMQTFGLNEGYMIRKILIGLWATFSVLWSAMCIFAFLLGAGMSVGDAHAGLAFLLYWSLPIGIPFAIYKGISQSMDSMDQKKGA